jgi:hypothetical protein
VNLLAKFVDIAFLLIVPTAGQANAGLANFDLSNVQAAEK